MRLGAFAVLGAFFASSIAACSGADPVPGTGDNGGMTMRPTGGAYPGGSAGASGAVTGGFSGGGALNGGVSGTGPGGAASGAAGFFGGASGAGGGGLGGVAPGGASGSGGAFGGSGGAGAGGTSAGQGGASGGAGMAGTGGRGGSGGAAGSSGTGGRGGGGTGGGGGAPGVRIVGRTATGTMGPRFSWPGVSIVARFSGTQASITLADASNRNGFEVIVDGTRRTPFFTVPGQTTYPLVSGLAAGNHDLVVWRRTEAYYNPTEFVGLTGFSSGGALLAPPAAPDRRIEIIGDSISAGYGIEGADSSCAGSETNENDYLAYGSVAARSLGADLSTIAWSGIGMWRNYNENGPSADAMPSRYDRTIGTDAASTWDFTRFQPHAVVINLTSNDYSTKGDPGAPYVTAYTTFVRHVRAVYPNAYIVCLILWNGSATNINSVVSTIRGGGDQRIESFDINVNAGGNACEGHPNVAKAQAMGDRLATEIRRVLGW